AGAHPRGRWRFGTKAVRHDSRDTLGDDDAGAHRQERQAPLAAHNRGSPADEEARNTNAATIPASTSSGAM
ncbi:MAG: hypothetical protein AVDCRST_MAG59-4111, partial [uncultured Thermomicrobiales bacterium]